MLKKALNFLTVNFWKIVLTVTGIAPLGLIISLLTFYIQVSIKIGRLPKFRNPFAEEFFNYVYFRPAVEFWGMIWVFSLLTWGFLAVTYLMMKRKNASWKLLLYTSIGQIIALIIYFSGILHWFMY